MRLGKGRGSVRLAAGGDHSANFGSDRADRRPGGEHRRGSNPFELIDVAWWNRAADEHGDVVLAARAA